MQLARDQFYDVINRLRYNDIRNLCQSDNTYARICREERFRDLINKKRSEHQDFINSQIDRFTYIINNLSRPVTIIYYLTNTHSIQFNINVKLHQMARQIITTVEDIVEHAQNLPPTEFILYNFLQTKIGKIDLFTLPKDQLIDLYVEEEALDLKENKLEHLIDKERTRKHQYSIPDEYFNYDSLIQFLFKRYKMEISSERRGTDILITLNDPTPQNIFWVLTNIYNTNDNPVVNSF